MGFEGIYSFSDKLQGISWRFRRLKESFAVSQASFTEVSGGFRDFTRHFRKNPLVSDENRGGYRGLQWLLDELHG